MSKDSKATKQTTGMLLSFAPTGEYYFTKGLKAYQRRDNHKAVKYLQRAMQLEPGEPMIACQLAIILSENGQYKEANQLLHTILEEWDEDMVECHYFLANNYAHLGLFKDAYHHASLYMNLEEDGEFVEDAEDLLDLLTLEAEDMEEDFYEHDDLISKQEEARAFLEVGDFPKAIQMLQEVLETYPEYWSAYNNLALAHYYLGENQKAEDLLNEVLEKNPGNLHALCNKVVFAYYEKDWKTVKALKEVLIKIMPLSVEHQFKLGTTFALIGEYEVAYAWLKKLNRQGFEGDGPFYYWLSYAAYHTGRMQIAEKSWKKVIRLNPEKEGQEPWNVDRPSISIEENTQAITNYLQSERAEERLFGLFLAADSMKKEELLSHFNAKNGLEEKYVDFLKGNEKDIPFSHKTAQELRHFHTIDASEKELYLMCFSINTESFALKNEKALAAAIDYVWRKGQNQKVSQQMFASQYGISISTIQKYVKIVKNFFI